MLLLLMFVAMEITSLVILIGLGLPWILQGNVGGFVILFLVFLQTRMANRISDDLDDYLAKKME